MYPAGRRLAWALGISAALHFLLLGAEIRLPRPGPAKTLTVQLEPLPPVAPPHPSTPSPPRPAQPPRPKPAPPKAPAPESSPVAQAAPEPAPAPAPPAPEPAGKAPPAPVAAPAVAPEAPARPLNPLPRRITLTYVLYKGDQKLNVGEMTHTWQLEGTQYTLTSLARATGLFSLFVRGTLIQVSRGELTADGLKPSEFWIQRGQSGDRTESASFDWGNRLLRYGRADDPHTIPLAPGTQDVLSVLYQLALTAPHSGVLDLAVTNGRKFDHYLYQALGEEMLETPLGTLKTEHLSKVRGAGEDGLDVWLAPDYEYLPVRLRIVDKNGDAAEQVVTSINAERAAAPARAP